MQRSALAWLALAGACGVAVGGGACASASGSQGAEADAAPHIDAALRPDAAVIVPDDGAAVINEFVANHVGVDQCEFVEIVGPPATDLSDHTVLVVEGDAGAANPGSVDGIIPVGATDAAGLWASPFLSNQIENTSMTLLLVVDFGGGAVDLDTDDDGTLDQEPWAELADAVAVSDGDPGDLFYAGGALLVPGFDGGGAMPVGGASRIPDGADTNQPGDWVRNGFEGQGLSCGTGSPEPGQALNTPGAPNAVQP